MSEHLEEKLSTEQVYNFNKCHMLHNALSLDKPTGHIGLEKVPLVWSDDQRAELAKAYHKLLLSL